jgi:hypothetical protein
MDVTANEMGLYYIKSGAKNVTLVPRHISRGIELKPGSRRFNLIIESSLHSEDYLHTIPAYWRFTVPAGAALVFNPNGCLHHFHNVYDDHDEPPQAFSLRYTYLGLGDERVCWLSMTDPLLWWNYAILYARMAFNPLSCLNTPSDFSHPPAEAMSKRAVPPGISVPHALHGARAHGHGTSARPSRKWSWKGSSGKARRVAPRPSGQGRYAGKTAVAMEMV